MLDLKKQLMWLKLYVSILLMKKEYQTPKIQFQTGFNLGFVFGRVFHTLSSPIKPFLYNISHYLGMDGEAFATNSLGNGNWKTS